MSTNSQTPNQDLPKDSKDVKQEELDSIAQTSSAEATNNTPDDPKACPDNPQETIQDNTDKEITGSSSGNSGNPSSVEEDKESNQQNEPSTYSQSVDNEGISTNVENSELLSKNDPNSQHQLKKYLKNLSTKLTRLDKEMNKILQENTQMRQEISSLNERVDRLEESEKFEFYELIKDAIKQDDLSWNEDSKECQEYKAQAESWHSKTKTLYESVSTAILDCGKRIDQCGKLMQDINKENSTLHNSLLDRYEILQLIKRMLDRLQEPLEILKNITFPTAQLLKLQEQYLVDALRSQTDEGEAKKILAKKIKETGDARYKIIREWRNIAEKTQKQWLNFIERRLLPILDGINNGKPHAEQLVAELRNSYKTESCQENLSSWLQTYVDLENILLETLNRLDVTQMTVDQGQEVNYERHEPIGTEPDTKLPNESIKEITRNGYEYKWEDKSLILRSTQVIVVKNS